MANDPPTGTDWMDFKRESGTGIESIRAHFAGHAYDPHTHDEVLVGVTLQGVQRFRCSRRNYQSVPGRAILIEPGQVHDGHAPDRSGFTYAMLYLPVPWFVERENALSGGQVQTDIAFQSALADDRALAASVWNAFRAQHEGESRMVKDHCFDTMLARLRSQSAPESLARTEVSIEVRRAKEYLHAHFAADIGLDQVSVASGIDRFRLTRQFASAYGLPPHAYLVRLRLRAARALLAQGREPATVATEVGFADQSHMGRWFRRAYRMSPAAYRQAAQTF